jgi:arylsulfatase A-like enzyme
VNVDQLAAQVDVAPTILDYLGISTDRPMYGRSLLAATTPAERSVVGVSSSRLLSLATREGAKLHLHGTTDLEDVAARAELDALFDTVLYFDQNPATFEPAVRAAAAPKQ